jgi:hypothetical protein
MGSFLKKIKNIINSLRIDVKNYRTKTYYTFESKIEKIENYLIFPYIVKYLYFTKL